MSSGNTVYAVGDIHGCPGMFGDLLRQIRADASSLGVARPKIVCLGDLVDRGPGSRTVLDMILSRRFRECFDATVLMGNHERMLLDAGKNDDSMMTWLHNGGAETVESYGVEFGRESARSAIRTFLLRNPRLSPGIPARPPDQLRLGK